MSPNPIHPSLRRTWRRFLYLSLATVLVATGCDDDGDGNGTGGDAGDTGGDGGGGDTGDTGDGTGESATFATFNLGLADNFVPYSDERQAPVAAELADIDADVVCLQEVWQDEAVQDVLDATADAFPYNFWVQTEDTTIGEPACNEQEIEPVVTCVEDNNCETAAEGLAACALDNCETEIDALSASNPECFSCAVANIGLPTVEEIQEACTVGAALFAFEGRNGLVLLSRYELTNTQDVVFESTANTRVVLSADVVLEPFGTVHVMCTHITAIFDDIPYAGEHGSWAEENAMQVGALATMAEAWGSDPGVLLGDMNTGPAVGSVEAEFEENFQLFVDAGFANEYVAQADPECTYGCDSTFHDEDASPKIIDHIFLQNWPTDVTFETSRILEQTIDIQVGEETVTTNLSDHFGVQLTITSAP